MPKFSLDEVVMATGGRCEAPGSWQEFTGVATDSRKIAGGELFFALAGPSFDGHAFAREALDKGARGVVLSSRDAAGELPARTAVIMVGDTLEALQKLAAHHRRRLGIPVVAVTGSSGKTTTKDMVSAMFSERLRCAKTQENFNNEIGVPLALLSLEPHHEMCVVELATRGAGQIRELAEIVRPDVGVVTNVGPSHLELLGSIENVAAAKRELVEALHPDGIAVLNADCPHTLAMKDVTRAKAVSFGLEHPADVMATDIESLGSDGTDFTMTYGQRSFRVRVPVPGMHNVYDALAAGATALVLGMDSRAVADGLLRFEAPHGRFQILETRLGLAVIDDTYNANPASMRAALTTMRDVAGARRKIAVLGDMLEVGEGSAEAHRDIGRAAAASCDVLVTVGDLARLAGEEALRLGMDAQCVLVSDDRDGAICAVRRLVRPGDVVLVKGSRAMRMEEVVMALAEGIGGGPGVS